MEQVTLHHPADHALHRTLQHDEIAEAEPLLVDILREGKLVYDLPTIEAMRRRREADVARLDPGVRRLINPHVYHVSLTERLWTLKQELIASALGNT
jgi:nicotinate phosphoribosyltransferase